MKCSWLLKMNCPTGISVFNTATEKGDLVMMKWLLEKRFRMNTYTYEAAVRNGNVENINWLLENDCPLDKFTRMLIYPDEEYSEYDSEEERTKYEYNSVDNCTQYDEE